MTALDGSVVNTVLPVINRAFHQEVTVVEWVVIIYLLVLSGLLLSFGRLGDIHGHKRYYVLGFGIFVVSSMFCGLSHNVQVLIVFRAIQALGAAMLAANSPAILTKNFPASQRGQALGLQAAMTYLGLMVGPSLGGWLTDTLGWRAVFYINVPVGSLAILLSMRFIPADLAEKTEKRFDFNGALLYTAGLTALMIALNQGSNLGWGSPVILGAMALAGICLLVFVRVEQSTPSPMLDLALFKGKRFSLAVICATLNYICIYTIVFLMPFYLIQGRSFSPSQTGLILTAQPIAMAIAAPLAGALSDRIGIRLLTTLGMALLGLGLYLLASLGQVTPVSSILLALGVAGLGTGIFISPNTSGLMGSAPKNRQGIASGVMATSRNLGMVIGVGLAGAIFTTILARSSLPVEQSLFYALQISFSAAVVIALLAMLISFSAPEQEHGQLEVSRTTR